MNAAWPTLLHVEDNLGDKQLLEHACRTAQLKCNLVWVEDGQAAVDFLSGVGPYSDGQGFLIPDLMLLDLKMPRRNGFEVLEWLRRQPQLKWLPVVVFTASDSAKDTLRALELGANSFLVKPTSYRDLVNCATELYHYWFQLCQLPPRPHRPGEPA